MATSSDASLSVVDTNVLVYAHLEDAPHHADSFALLEQTGTDSQMLAVAPQILMEFYAVITDSRRVSTPFTVKEAREAIGRILGLPGMTLLPIPLDVVDRTVLLAVRHRVTGSHVFDMQIAATMFGNGVFAIYTYDTKGFSSMGTIAVKTPPLAN